MNSLRSGQQFLSASPGCGIALKAAGKDSREQGSMI